ncbi:ABC transporter ATP-binding protein [Acetanaerobacterium elongatum]|uniref:ABC-2 type transport system ATP-binding protein n=1 Tax=Acetanaerobacterium elongatum TaxID=258515 RepID=A0A1H0C6D1_9FIRM|nr:ABC transporter ATP-binding protein [Acetanaerobacterium elongatum]SDN53440.1 ABC-2 type transport system ATP-binding protein [Acetanaerobacterium elongatum]
MQVCVSHVSKSFKKQQVLKDISLTIENNEIFGLIGPSGAGKTTLIRLIIGAVNADEGEIKIGNIKIPSLRALRDFGYMPQNDALYYDLSGYDNLMFFGGMYGIAKPELKKRAHEVLKLVDLEHDGGKKVSNYSGGMKKRLSLAVALLAEPGLLILDEPTVGIDPLLRRRIWEQFNRLKEQGKTIIVTTHVMDEAVMCDRLALIYNGGVLACDGVDALLARTPNHTIEELFFNNGAQA